MKLGRFASSLCLAISISPGTSFDGEDLAVGEMDETLVGGAAETKLKRALGNDKAAINEPINLVEKILAFGLFPKLLKRPT